MRRQLADLQQLADAQQLAVAGVDLLQEHGGGSDDRMHALQERMHALQEHACWLHCVDARDLGDRVLAPKDVFSSKGNDQAGCGLSAALGRRWELAPAGVATAGVAGVTGASGKVEVEVEEALGKRWEALLTAEERGLLQQV